VGFSVDNRDVRADVGKESLTGELVLLCTGSLYRAKRLVIQRVWKTENLTCVRFVYTLTRFGRQDFHALKDESRYHSSQYVSSTSSRQAFEPRSIVTHPVAKSPTATYTSSMATLPTIPPEVQLMIANRVDERDVLALNSISRHSQRP
jgi:hypothetical protein